MAAAMNKIMMYAAIITLVQAGGQFLFTSLGLLQYFCVIDFLVEVPLLVFIRILYFHNPLACGVRVNVGQVLDGVSNSAFVLLINEPFTVTRTLIINAAGLGLSLLWMITCIGLLRGGASNKKSKPVRWPWIIVTVLMCGVDLVATVTYANDSFHTRTLSDTMDFIGGVASGVGSYDVSTVWLAWTMVLIYSRFGVIFVLNLILLIMVVIDGSKTRTIENTAVQVEAPTMTTTEMNTNTSNTSDKEDDDVSLPSETPAKILPRPGLRQSFRQMKARLFRQPSPAARSLPNSLDVTPERSPRAQHVEIDNKRHVNFPENLLSLPQRLENLIAEQQRRLDKAVIDTSGRRSPPRASQSLPHLASSSQDPRGLSVESPNSNQVSQGMELDLGAAARRPSSRGSSPGPTFLRRLTLCATNYPLMRTSHLFRSRIIPLFHRLEKPPSTEQLLV